MGAGIKTPVEAPPARPPITGLIVSAEMPDDGKIRWEGSFGFEPESCTGSGVGNPCGGFTKEVENTTQEVSFEPFVVWAGDHCGGLGGVDRDRLGRAKRLLESCQSKEIEKELWTGTLAQAEGWTDNRRLASPDSDVLSDGPTSIVDAISCLEAGLGFYLCGGQGMIHVPHEIVTWMASQNLVDRVPATDLYPGRKGWILLTKLGTIVVPGTGYDGSGPDGQPAAEGSVWIYGTSIVQVRMTETVTLPRTEAELFEAINRENNDIDVIAEKLAAVTWDGCTHLAVELDLSLCDVGGAGS